MKNICPNADIGKTCPYCQFQLKRDSSIINCPLCNIPHHFECWLENRGCTTYGCDSLIETSVESDESAFMEEETEGFKTNTLSKIKHISFLCGLLLSGLFAYNYGVVREARIAYKGGTYIGEIRHRKPNGIGALTYNDGESFDGEWFDGKFIKGSWSNLSGDKYEGAFNNFVFHGQGLFISSTGERFEGEWVNGSIQKGTWIEPYVGKYQGAFNEFSFHGHGVFNSSTGERYEGEWVKGYLAKGTWESPLGEKYTGGFNDLKFDNYGKLVKRDGSSYIGEWRNGEFHGKGEWTDGSVIFYGSFRGGKQHGLGVYIHANGKLNIGVWNYGEATCYNLQSFGANITDLNFYESGNKDVPLGNRRYDTRFPSRDARFINYDYTFRYPELSKYGQMSEKFIIYKLNEEALPNYNIFNTVYISSTESRVIQTGWDYSIHTWGYGSETPGAWSKGTYYLDLFIDRQLAAVGRFEIY